MLIYLYLFGLIVGGVLLGSSLILGGHDADADADVDADFDADLDADADADAHLGDHLAHGAPVASTGADLVLWRFRSLRFWTFFLAFFGLCGTLLEGLGLVESPLLTLVAALGMGGFAGFGSTEVVRRLSADTSGAAPESQDYVGKSARVVVPVRPGGVGKVRIQLKGTTVDVLAETLEDEFEAREEALIVEMDGTKARIARVEPRQS
jgi:membrane protein implicated in regulation of membrane protease activity